MDITATGQAAKVRKELRAAFPGQKFQVITRRGNMYDLIYVSWIGGPERAAVELVADRHQRVNIFTSYDHIAA